MSGGSAQTTRPSEQQLRSVPVAASDYHHRWRETHHVGEYHTTTPSVVVMYYMSDAEVISIILSCLDVPGRSLVT